MDYLPFCVTCCSDIEWPLLGQVLEEEVADASESASYYSCLVLSLSKWQAGAKRRPVADISDATVHQMLPFSSSHQ